MVVCILRSDIDLARHFLITPLPKTFGSRPDQPLNFPLLLCRDVHVICLFLNCWGVHWDSVHLFCIQPLLVATFCFFIILVRSLGQDIFCSALSEELLRLQLPLYLSRYFFLSWRWSSMVSMGIIYVLFVCMQYLIIYFVWCRQYKNLGLYRI